MLLYTCAVIVFARVGHRPSRRCLPRNYIPIHCGRYIPMLCYYNDA